MILAVPNCNSSRFYNTWQDRGSSVAGLPSAPVGRIRELSTNLKLAADSGSVVTAALTASKVKWPRAVSLPGGESIRGAEMAKEGGGMLFAKVVVMGSRASRFKSSTLPFIYPLPYLQLGQFWAR
jgi:hypothetical protein